MVGIAFVALTACGSSDAPVDSAQTPVTADTATPTVTATTVPAATSILPPEETSTPTATTAVAPSPTTAAAPTATPEPASTTAPSDAARAQGELQGVTFEIGEGSEATFTVREKLARLPLPNDAVVRTTALSGELHLDGRPSVFEIDLHQLSSDQSRRDSYIRRTMFPGDPVAVFTVDDIGSLPSGFTDGDTVSATIGGKLAIRGAEFPISFDVEARDDGDVIFIVGRTSFVWADLDIRPPNIGGIVQVEDDVKVEVLLAARPL
jgi:hypothetical protein